MSNISNQKMLELFTQSTTTISKIVLHTLHVEFDIDLDATDCDFSITIINKNEGEGIRFYFYTFGAIETIQHQLKQIVETLKSDDFSKIATLYEAFENE